ncbi:hypothetical protein EDB87DRAFT_1820209 [Lactarius vividus]|nr:hypothetical protein EDB87DRAFT_1820209 [Lactarius vividus]
MDLGSGRAYPLERCDGGRQYQRTPRQCDPEDDDNGVYNGERAYATLEVPAEIDRLNAHHCLFDVAAAGRDRGSLTGARLSIILVLVRRVGNRPNQVDRMYEAVAVIAEIRDTDVLREFLETGWRTQKAVDEDRFTDDVLKRRRVCRCLGTRKEIPRSKKCLYHSFASSARPTLVSELVELLLAPRACRHRVGDSNNGVGEAHARTTL